MEPAADPNDFWLALHKLVEAYDAQGLTTQERMECAMRAFRAKPPTVRRALLGDAWRVAVNLSDVSTIAQVVALEMDASEAKQSRSAAG